MKNTILTIFLLILVGRGSNPAGTDVAPVSTTVPIVHLVAPKYMGHAISSVTASLSGARFDSAIVYGPFSTTPMPSISLKFPDYGDTTNSTTTKQCGDTSIVSSFMNGFLLFDTANVVLSGSLSVGAMPQYGKSGSYESMRFVNIPFRRWNDSTYFCAYHPSLQNIPLLTSFMYHSGLDDCGADMEEYYYKLTGFDAQAELVITVVVKQ